jgi:hypothetical protein
MNSIALSGAHKKGFLVWMNRMFCPELMGKNSFWPELVKKDVQLC